MAIAYSEFDQRTDTIWAGIKQRILASSDWAHLPTTGANTTLTSGAAAGATSANLAASVGVGAYITIGIGSPNPEVRLVTTITGTGPYVTSWTTAEPLVGTYSTGAVVGQGTYVKAVTGRGAQMVLGGATPTTTGFTVSVFNAHDGTTAGPSTTRSLSFKRSAGAATNILHARVSAWADGLYIDIEGPRLGETGADSATGGSYRQCIALSDITPYNGGDTTAAFSLISGPTTASAAATHVTGHTSKNMDGTVSFPTTTLRTLAYPNVSTSSSVTTASMVPVARNGDYVLSPYFVIDTDGIRGRATHWFYGGMANSTGDGAEAPAVVPGAEMTYGAFRYRALTPFRTDGSGSSACCYGFGIASNQTSSTQSPVVWIPVATSP